MSGIELHGTLRSKIWLSRHATGSELITPKYKAVAFVMLRIKLLLNKEGDADEFPAQPLSVLHPPHFQLACKIGLLGMALKFHQDSKQCRPVALLFVQGFEKFFA